MPNMMAEMIERQKRIEAMLTKPVEPPQPARFGLNDALNYINELGFAMSKSKFTKLSADRKLPCDKFNGRLVFKKADLDLWIESQTVAIGDSSNMALTLKQNI